jgi:hypothetical protein
MIMTTWSAMGMVFVADLLITFNAHVFQDISATVPNENVPKVKHGFMSRWLMKLHMTLI